MCMHVHISNYTVKNENRATTKNLKSLKRNIFIISVYLFILNYALVNFFVICEL